MKFIPTKKEKWIRFMKENGYQFTDERLSEIYVQMCRDVAMGLMAAEALGGRWENGSHDVQVLDSIYSLDEDTAANLLAAELDVDASTVNPGKALEYLVHKQFES